MAAAVAACVGVGFTATADAAGRGVPDSKISIQLWTFAEYIGFGTDADPEAYLMSLPPIVKW